MAYCPLHKFQSYSVSGRCNLLSFPTTSWRLSFKVNLLLPGLPMFHSGWVLGPTLFLVHINDFSAHPVWWQFNPLLFSSNSSMLLTVSWHSEVGFSLNNELESVLKWGNDWLVNFNATKNNHCLCLAPEMTPSCGNVQPLVFYPKRCFDQLL